MDDQRTDREGVGGVRLPAMSLRRLLWRTLFARYEAIFMGPNDGFELELRRLSWFRRSQWAVNVFRSENIEPGFKIYVNQGVAPDPIVADFVERAKIELQQRYEDWAEAFPELAFPTTQEN